jgi:hypothetical protein
LKCLPEATPQCIVKDFGWPAPDHPAYCWCEEFRLVPNPDGGPGYIPWRCVHNPDGGPPICGKWDGYRGVILDLDGGIIVDEDGGIR